jgi:hypothetical protein
MYTGASEGVPPPLATTTAADSKRDARAAKRAALPAEAYGGSPYQRFDRVVHCW